MIWKGQKPGDACKGCGDTLIDEPWSKSPEKKNPMMRWLVHEKTLLTICKE